MRANFTAFLKDVGQGELSLVGGKGANLGEMLQAGLPVPEGFVLLTTAYRQFVTANELDQTMQVLLSDLDGNDFESIEPVCTKIQELFLDGEIPEEIRNEIKTAYKQIGRGGVAVRSSATAEDLPGTSFAGQYDTYLNVSGEEQLLRTIKQCWASLWNSRALSYRLKYRIGNDQIGQGVVVQKMINSSKSGVLFTADPVSGRRDQMLLNSSWGLGEAIVHGDVTPDQWILDRKKSAIVQQAIANKEVMTVRTDEGIEISPVPRDKQKQPTLSTGEVLELLKLGERLVEYFGSPQDIEWAFADNNFYLVQTRLITSLFPLPKPQEADQELRIYLNMGLYSQALHEPLTPMGEEVFFGMFKSFAKLVNREYAHQPVRWCKTAGGRVFVDLTELLRNPRIRKKLENNPAEKDPQSIKALLWVAEQNKGELQTTGVSPIYAMLKIITKLNPWVIKFLFTSLYKVIYGSIYPQKAVSRAVQHGEAQIVRLTQDVKRRQATADKLQYLEEEATKLIFVGMFEVVFFVAASTTYIHKAKRIIEKHGLAAPELAKVEKSIPNNVTTEMGMRLLGIAKKMDENGENPSANHREIQRFLEDYGHRSSNEIDIGIPRWREDPKYIIDLVQAYMDGKDYDEKINRFYQGRKGAEQAILSISSKLRERGAKRDARRVEALLRNYRKMFGVRELPKYYLTKAFDVLREMLQDVGHNLQQQGKLADSMDIFFVRFQELKNFSDLKQIVEQNKAEYRRELERHSVPRVMTSTGETVYSLLEDESEHVYRGVPVSPGVCEGRVRVLSRPEEGKGLQKGEILVTKGTNPAWTPLFLRIGGLIMETGGPISHGSVVAREYGVPAVAGVSAAVDRLTDGQRVRLNGETGTVEILEG